MPFHAVKYNLNAVKKSNTESELNMDPAAEFEVEIAPAKPFDQGAPHINGPAVYGASPNADFLYYIPVRGERPLAWEIMGELPPGLSLNKDNGIISGKAEKEGIWNVMLKAVNRLGQNTKPFRIEIAPDHLALTPLMGWTSWNVHSTHVREEHIFRAATLLCKTGLREFGYSYVNTDSCWQGSRETAYSALQPNRFFPSMREMTEHIHLCGLKAGIYSTPMVHAWGSCAERPALFGSTGYPLNPDAFVAVFGGCGQTHFEAYDARQWADWGFDYMKYDWPLCDPEYTKSMGDALRATGRDFVYSLTTSCKPEYMDTYRQYGNMFRSNSDTCDLWDSGWTGGLVKSFFPADEWLKFTGPGHWFDMDMLALGDISGITNCAWNRLTRNEQISHMAVWAFMASPLQLSCDLGNIDPFTMALFTNEELLEVNQDELGAGAVRESGNGYRRIYTRRMANGDTAAAFINTGDDACEMVLERPGKTLAVRDVLACRDLGSFTDRIAFTVPKHGTRIVRFR